MSGLAESHLLVCQVMESVERETVVKLGQDLRSMKLNMGELSGEACVCELCDGVELGQHLADLRQVAWMSQMLVSMAIDVSRVGM